MSHAFADVRHDLDVAGNFGDIHGTPWYSDAEYDRFDDEEFRRRHEAARALCRRDGFDALILTGGQNVYSLGSGVTWSTGLTDERGMCQYVVLGPSGDPILVYPHTGCHIEAARQQVSPTVEVRSGRGGRFGAAIAQALRDRGVTSGRVGITVADTMGPEYMGMSTHLDLVAELPDVEWVRARDLFHELTVVKNDVELAAMARAGELAVAAHDAVARAAVPGATEQQLAAAGTATILAGGGQIHLMMISSSSMHDPRNVYPSPIPSRRVLRDGDYVLCEIAAAHMGYSAKLGQPISVGPPTPSFEAFHRDVALVGFRAALETLTVGTPLDDIRAAASAFRRVGAQSRPVLVHGIDLITAGPKVMVHDVVARPFDDPLRAGMVLNIEAAPISADGTFGSFVSRTYAVREDGPVDLTPYPLDEMIRGG